jgi:DNA-binding PadR family transcriptional regulator
VFPGGRTTFSRPHESLPVDNEETQRKFLADILDRTERGERPLMIPVQYTEVFGVTMHVAETNLEYMAQKGWIRARIEDTNSGRFVFVYGITNNGVDRLREQEATSAAPNQPNHSFQGVRESLVALGSHNVQGQNPNIRSFQELYLYLDRNLNSQQVSTLRPMLNEVEVEIRDESVRPATLKKIAALTTAYGPPVATALEFITRQLGLRG